MAWTNQSKNTSSFTSENKNISEYSVDKTVTSSFGVYKLPYDVCPGVYTAESLGQLAYKSPATGVIDGIHSTYSVGSMTGDFNIDSSNFNRISIFSVGGKTFTYKAVSNQQKNTSTYTNQDKN